MEQLWCPATPLCGMRSSSQERVSPVNSLEKSWALSQLNSRWRCVQVGVLEVLSTHIFKPVKHRIDAMKPSKCWAHIIGRDQEPSEEKEHRTGETSIAETFFLLVIKD